MQGFTRVRIEYADEKIIVSRWEKEPTPERFPYLIYDFGNAASVLAASSDEDPNERQVVLLDAFKQAAGRSFITCQAGRINKELDGAEFRYSESPEEAAAREAFEESNVAVGELIPLGIIHRLPGNAITEEHCFLAIAGELRDLRVNDPNERLDLRIMSWAEMMKKVRSEPDAFDIVTLSVIMRANAHLYGS